MGLKSSSQQYGSVAILIHWMSAILILVLLGTGFRAESLSDPVAKLNILRVHVPLGITILLLTLLRIMWWLFADTKPQSVPMPRWQDRISRAVHVLFYIVILGTTASGIGMLVLSGAGTILFGGTAGPLPDFEMFLPRGPHGLGAKAILALFIVHSGAALYHHFVKRDGLLRRMWPTSSNSSVDQH